MEVAAILGVLCCKVTPFSPFPYCAPIGQALCAPCRWGEGSRVPPSRAEGWQKSCEFICMRDLVLLSHIFIDSIVYLDPRGLMDIYFVLLRAIWRFRICFIAQIVSLFAVQSSFTPLPCHCDLLYQAGFFFFCSLSYFLALEHILGLCYTFPSPVQESTAPSENPSSFSWEWRRNQEQGAPTALSTLLCVCSCLTSSHSCGLTPSVLKLVLLNNWVWTNSTSVTELPPDLKMPLRVI